MTAPVRDWQVVLSKFFGALVFYIVLWIPTLLYFVIFQAITQQPAAQFDRRILRLLPHAAVARHVLPFRRLLRFRR